MKCHFVCQVYIGLNGKTDVLPLVQNVQVCLLTLRNVCFFGWPRNVLRLFWPRAYLYKYICSVLKFLHYCCMRQTNSANEIKD